MRLFDFLASLRLTVVLLSASMVLVFLATLEQVPWGVWHIQDEYFESWGVLYPLSKTATFRFPLPGGFLLGLLLCLNLLAAHFRHYRPGWGRIGISLTHGGLLLLLVGGFAIALWQKESAMIIAEGETKAFTEAFRDHEVAIIEVSDPTSDHVDAFPTAMLRGGDVSAKVGRNGQLIANVRSFQPNAIVRPLSQAPELKPLGLARPEGLAARQPMGMSPLPESFDDNRPNNPFAIVQLSNGADAPVEVAVCLLFHENFPAQRVEIGGRSYEIGLRRERTYLPFSLSLRKFIHERHPGTDIPRRFASDVTVNDAGSRRDFFISMNEPLRHGGYTFYQSSYGEDGGKALSVLQVVRNPAAWIPYLAVGVMSLGLLFHFGVMLAKFLTQRGKSTLAALALALVFPTDAIAADTEIRTGLAHEFGKLPVQWNGRVVPVELVASNTLLQIRGRRTVALDAVDQVAFGKPRDTWTAEERTAVEAREPRLSEAALASLARRPMRLQSGSLSASEWLAETAFRPWVARHLRVFRVDHPSVHGILGRAQGESKWYSWHELLAGLAPIEAAAKQARGRPQADRDAADRALLNLESALRAYATISLAFIPPDLPPDISPTQEYRAWVGSLQRAAVELARNRQQGSNLIDPELQETLRSLLQRYQSMAREGVVGLSPRPGTERWATLGTALLEAAEGKPLDQPDVIPAYARMAEAWRDGRDADVRGEIQVLAARLTGAHSTKVGLETGFIRLEIFYKLLLAYVALLLLSLLYWLTGKEGMRKWGVWIAWTVFALHTGAIVARMLIHGYAPVTNLYGSTIFVAWGAVLLGLLLERSWRNGLGLAAACASGFGSLIIAHNMSLAGEDAIESVRAVLDSNFWLSTHVTIVTLGYSAMFVAGTLATFHLVGRLVSSRYAAAESTQSSLDRSSYGVLAFALTASFIGTMLGGIWADQSWGRFWGWDPKENGALLIVLWCALALHCRWGRLVDREGLMQILVFGNIVTAWSWFGTNLLGVGLHSYGFTESGFFWLSLYAASQVFVIALGWLPARASALPPIPQE
jgi:ABC-type transport system involved in cytochrome c biogenesis permease subunit